MRILTIHSDYLKVEPQAKAIEAGYDPESQSLNAEDALVVFTAVEKDDETNEAKVVENAVKEIVNIYNQVKAKEIVIYPYSHLSSNLAPPYPSNKILNSIVEKIKEIAPVKKAPFGYYKAFELKCKGHPLSELSRQITAEINTGDDDSSEKAETIEEKAHRIKSKFIVLTPEGQEYNLDFKKIADANFLDNYLTLKKMIYSEEIKGQPSEIPPSIKAMRHLELIDYEPAADSGHFRFYPKGALIKDLIAEWAETIALKRFGALKIDTPILYDWSEPDIRAQGESFHERHYVVYGPNKKEKEMVLRFAGDFGLFKMMKDAVISYKHLPISMFEMSPSFRYERKSELTGLKRLRGFTMPDIHTFCTDVNQAKNMYKKLFESYTVLANGTNIEYGVIFRVVKVFWDENKEWFVNLLKIANKPSMIEILDEQKHYWLVKHEFQGLDSVGGNVQLSTVQLDLHDGARYNIIYTDKNGNKIPVIINHSSIGSLERWIYIILEEALKTKTPTLPLWLSPTQVRIILVNESHLKFAEDLANKLEEQNIRVDIDDADATIGKKIMNAEQEWTPYQVVVGDKEMNGDEFQVRVRAKNGEIISTNLQGVADLVKKETEGKPFKPLPLPRLLSKRPKFVG